MKNVLFIAVILFLPGSAFAQSGVREVAICKGTSIRLKAASADASKYEWHKNDQVIPDISGSDLVISEEGNYTAYALNADGCSSNASVAIHLIFNRPVATDDMTSGKSDVELLLDVLNNDQSLCTVWDTTTLTIRRAPLHGTVFRSHGKFRFKGNQDYKGIDTFTYSVKDAAGQESNTATVTVDLSTPLPVTMISFEANKEGLTSLLTWATSIEMNSDRFEIERSPDAKNWDKLGEVSAAVNSEVRTNYHFTDETPESGMNYYRLKMVDRDGTFAYSRIRSVNFPEFAWAKLFPNPVSDVLQIVISNKRVRKIRLIDSFGHVMYDGQVTAASIKLDMKSYAHGIYFIHLEQEDGTVRVFKIAHQ
ncbi:Ig-like domain-containing protein [Dyadobacter diqingensis]|uniref:Ig-like domain-containing protein n=1 Tax=Dyadobacter diqingensis TaxID=2938121 RepID=UPI0020C3F57B|nr:T9SS type A sorting domain-containing protein [Dyadobacter diqingensis]